VRVVFQLTADKAVINFVFLKKGKPVNIISNEKTKPGHKLRPLIGPIIAKKQLK